MHHYLWRGPEWADPGVIELAAAARGHVAKSLTLAEELSSRARPRGRRTWDHLRTLASLGAVDLTTARVVEPHLDAHAILDEAGESIDTGHRWGVYAARAPGQRLRATRQGDSWLLSGAKPWCSLAGMLDRALVTAEAEDGDRLFRVDLRAEGLEVEPSGWVSRGMPELTTTSVRMTRVPATPVGPAGWYLTRRGFAHGGVGVAAVWFGAAATLAGTLIRMAGTRQPDQVALWAIGRCDLLLDGALLALRHAAGLFDEPGPAVDEEVVAARVRGCVAEAAQEILTVVGRATGPWPLTHDEEHARRVADLTVYVRQHHAERDLARLGSLVLEGQES